MCYSVKVLLETQLKRASRHADEKAIKEIQKKLNFYGPKDYHYVSGFNFPALLIYTGEHPFVPQPAQWGLVPFWVKDRETADQIRSRTLNARGETIYEKASFKAPAKYRRGILEVDGFYEYHHFNKSAYPFYVFRKDQKPLTIGILHESWTDKNTGEILPSFSIVTKRRKCSALQNTQQPQAQRSANASSPSRG